MLSVLCVLRSGGAYDAEWVRKLRDGVARNITVPHRFVCLSDVDVPCDRIPLVQDWPGWWAKIELFRPGVVTGPTLYLDLDTVIVDKIDALANITRDFSMLRGFGRKHYIGSGVMLFKKPLTTVYESFLKSPERFIEEYATNPNNRHQAFNAAVGDQAFIYDAIGNENIHRLTDSVPNLIQCYPKTFNGARVPTGCSVVCFKGKIKPPDAMHLGWCRENWK